MLINQQVDKENMVAFVATWMELETIILSEVTQEWKTNSHVFSLISGSQAMRMQRHKNDKMDFGDWGGDKLLHIGYRVHCSGDGCTKISEITTEGLTHVTKNPPVLQNY